MMVLAVRFNQVDFMPLEESMSHRTSAESTMSANSSSPGSGVIEAVLKGISSWVEQSAVSSPLMSIHAWKNYTGFEESA